MAETPQELLSMLVTTSFPLFSQLYEELRLQIWIYALPGSRIVYVKRHLVDKEQDAKESHKRSRPETPYATYFSSPSPQADIPSLLLTCVESKKMVQRFYKYIFPGTWFDYERDYLYLDMAYAQTRVAFGLTYQLNDFSPGTPGVTRIPTWDQIYAPPTLSNPFPAEIKHLVLSASIIGGITTKLVSEILLVFTSLETLVLGEPLHDEFDSDQTLTWSLDEVGDELLETPVVLTSMFEYYQGDNDEYKHLLYLKSLIHWSTKLTHHPTIGPPQPQILKEALKRLVRKSGWSETRKIPAISQRVVLPRLVKNQLVGICGSSESDFRKLRHIDEDLFDLDEPSMTGRTGQEARDAYDFECKKQRIQDRIDQGDSLSCTQQLMYVELVISKLRSQLRKLRSAGVTDIDKWERKRNELMNAESEVREGDGETESSL